LDLCIRKSYKSTLNKEQTIAKPGKRLICGFLDGFQQINKEQINPSTIRTTSLSAVAETT
jgi:hypothetical protein